MCSVFDDHLTVKVRWDFRVSTESYAIVGSATVPRHVKSRMWPGNVDNLMFDIHHSDT